MVIFDQNEKLVHEEAKYLGICTNNFAEYNALMQALSAAKYLKATHLEIFSDSDLLVRQFSGEYKIKNTVLFNLMAEIMREAAKYKVTLSYIPRAKNKVADKLVNQILNKIKINKRLGKSIQKENEKKFHQPDLF